MVRDGIYLKRLATETALPVASPTSNGGAVAERGLSQSGRVCFSDTTVASG